MFSAMANAGVVSLTNLMPVIDKAVAAVASSQIKSSLDPSAPAVTSWHIIGRQLQNVDPVVAHEFSTKIAEQVSLAGTKVEPVTLMIGKGGAIAGFFPVDQISKIQL